MTAHIHHVSGQFLPRYSVPTPEVSAKIGELRQQGLGKATIAETLGLTMQEIENELRRRRTRIAKGKDPNGPGSRAPATSEGPSTPRLRVVPELSPQERRLKLFGAEPLRAGHPVSWGCLRTAEGEDWWGEAGGPGTGGHGGVAPASRKK